ncbi:MAG: InlB B-repeat-containing protein, partial [Lachnospiraceae bacterium]|nr:InlB B-repeat-containing protein [Lachnospiraceae bacterium]
MIGAKKAISFILVVAFIISMSFLSLGEDEGSDIFLIEKETVEISSNSDIVEYEQALFEEIEERFKESLEEGPSNELIDELVEESKNEEVVIATVSIVDKIDIDNEERRTITAFELEDNLFGAGNHTSSASPSVVINSTYDRYEIYTGENAGTVKISDNNGTYYNNNTTVKVIRDMIDTHNNSPILLKLSNDVQFFDFDNANDNYILLPNGFVEDLVARESGNGYLNPQGINALDHIKVDLTFNSTDLGKYDLFEYGVLYYLSCYEGVLGEYYYYDPNTTDIDRAATFYVNNRIMDRTYNIVSEYYYKSPTGESLSFKPTWLINSDSLTGSNKEAYAKQWVNFPYFLIKTGEKYWNLRDSIEQSTYLAEYAEGYYEQYLTEAPYGNVAERLVVLDDIYKSEADLLNDNTSTVAVHPYVKSSAIEISGNFRADTINEENKLKSGGMLPYDTYAVINLNVTERRAKSIQVYLNGEKLISNNNRGLYTLTNGKCQIRIDGSKLLDEENSRNVISFIAIDETGNYVTDSQGRIINSYISLIRSTTINRQAYTISFNTNGGSSLNSVSVEEGNILSLPSNPSKQNKNFLGWYNDTAFQDKFNYYERY